MSIDNSLEQINNLFRILLRVHKSLLDFQKLATETFEQRKFSSYDILQLAFNHPEFEWLRKISVIMSEMDEATSDKKNLPTEAQLKDFARRLNEIFSENSQDFDFKRRLDVALARDTRLFSEVAELRLMLIKTLN
ncbi:hypothetical protein K2P97_13055 [bacterium]|nr:hypothetical protein [bacterium]